MKLARNSLFSLGGSIVPTVISIATIPFFVAQIGAERYGALAIAWLVLGYFGAADFGIGRAITQRIAAMRGETRSAMARAVWSALFSMVGFGLAGAAILFVFASWYFAGPFQVEEGLRSEIMSAVWVLALCNPMVAINGVLSGALMGLERFKLVSASMMIANSALLLFPLAIAYFVTVDLSALILAALCARLIGVAILSIGVWRVFLRGQRPSFSNGEMRLLANFGAWIMVTALVGPLMVMSDRFVIGAVQDAAAVAAYAIPFQIASRTLMFPIAVTQSLFPRFAAEEAGASQERCRQFTAFLGLLFAPMVIGLICLAAPLLELWLGGELDPRSISVAQLILAGFWVNAIANVPYGYIQARGHPRFTALLHLAELPVYFALLVMLGLNFGLPGFAAAFGLRCAIDCVALIHRAGAASLETWMRLAGPAILIGAALFAAPMMSDWLMLIALAAALVGGALICLIVATPPSIRQRLVALPGVPTIFAKNGKSG